MSKGVIKYRLNGWRDREAIEQHNRDLQEDETSIRQAIKDFGLDKFSRDRLEYEAARWMLELDALKYATDEPVKTQRKSSIEFLRFWMSGIVTNEDGEPNKLGKVIKKYLSRTNTPNSKSARPKAGATKPTKSELDEFRVRHQGERERDGVTGDHGWVKAASRHYGYSTRQISRILNEK